MSLEGDHIFTLAGDELVLRRGFLEFDEASTFPGQQVDFGPLHVSSGLLPGDFAVFITTHEEEGQSMDVGYLVTEVGRDASGTGIIVGGELVNRDPRSWVNTRLTEMWRLLHGEGYDIGEKLGLTALQAYLTERSSQTKNAS